MVHPCPYESSFHHGGGKIVFMIMSALSGSLSIIGSVLILHILSQGGWTKLSRPHNRLLLGICIIDVFSSTACGFSIIPTPQETECSIGMGNLSTCAAQGFFIQLSLAVPAYNAMISLYYLLTIRYGMSQAIISEKYELFMHAFAIIPTLTTAIIGLASNMYFSERAVCWIGDICQSEGNCPTGNVWGKGYGIAIASISFTGLCGITTVFCMLLISGTLRKRNLAMSQYGFRRQRDTLVSVRRLNTIEFAAAESAKQAYLYAAVFILTYIWPFCDLLVASITGKANVTPIWLFYLAAVFLPLQGFWNFFVYVRPIVSKIRRYENDDDDSLTFIAALKMIILDREEESNTDINTNARLDRNTNTNEDCNVSNHSAEYKTNRRESILSICNLSTTESLSDYSNTNEEPSFE